MQFQTTSIFFYHLLHKMGNCVFPRTHGFCSTSRASCFPYEQKCHECVDPQVLNYSGYMIRSILWMQWDRIDYLQGVSLLHLPEEIHPEPPHYPDDTWDIYISSAAPHRGKHTSIPIQKSACFQSKKHSWHVVLQDYVTWCTSEIAQTTKKKA